MAEPVPLRSSPTETVFPPHAQEATDATLVSPRPSEIIHSEIKPPTPQKAPTLPGSDPTCLPPITVGRQRTLVLCFDGTGDQFDNDNSNIALIFSMLKKDDRTTQMCYYQAGIGTYTGRTFTFPGATFISKKLDSAVAWALKVHVQDGYKFLMRNYLKGDKICLFGFSRGAYTARALAGMLHKVGLLPPDNEEQIPFAYKLFTDVSENGWSLSSDFKKSFNIDVKIDFIGVFDTVSSVGVIGKKLPFAASNFAIKYFRHAMALDERRARFKVYHYISTKVADEGHGDPRCAKKSVRKGLKWKQPTDLKPTDVKEVWFSGCHCDVGGGSVDNDTPNNLARIPLRWMVRETFGCNTGILWDIDGLKSIGLDPDTLYPNVIIPPPSTPSPTPIGTLSANDNKSIATVTSTSSTAPLLSPSAISSSGTTGAAPAVDLEHLDATSPIYDQLKISPIWWLLEFIPTQGKRQQPPPDDEDHWHSYYFVNLGKGRTIPRSQSGVHIHSSVKRRLDWHEGKYKWKAVGNIQPIWVD